MPLSIEIQEKMFHALNDWFLTTKGHLVGRAFNDELKALIDVLHGESLIQLGSCGDNPWLPELRYMHKWIVSPVFDSAGIVLQTSLNQLPIQRDSVDCILAPLTLNAFSHHEKLFDEVDRILKPMGYIIFLAINPLSLWGLWLKFNRTNCFSTTQGGLYSSLFTQRSFIQRGYELCHLSNFFYVPPVTSDHLLNALSILNVIGKMISPLPSGFYCLIVQKRQEDFLLPKPMTLHESANSPVIPSLSPACQQKLHK